MKANINQFFKYLEVNASNRVVLRLKDIYSSLKLGDAAEIIARLGDSANWGPAFKAVARKLDGVTELNEENVLQAWLEVLKERNL